MGVISSMDNYETQAQVTPEAISTVTVENTLESVDRAEYPSPSEHYKLLIEDARALGDRRETINNLFVGLFSLIAGGLGYVLITFPGRLPGLVVTIAVTLFGLGLCRVWENVLGNYKALLDMRYSTLRIWEQRFNFPSLQQYYISEDILYEPLQSPPELAQLIPQKLKGKAGAFVSMYVVLPKTARRMFYALLALQVFALLGRVALLIAPPDVIHAVPSILLQLLT
jgi:hypothetical protein